MEISKVQLWIFVGGRFIWCAQCSALKPGFPQTVSHVGRVSRTPLPFAGPVISLIHFTEFLGPVSRMRWGPLCHIVIHGKSVGILAFYSLLATRPLSKWLPLLQNLVSIPGTISARNAYPTSSLVFSKENFWAQSCQRVFSLTSADTDDEKQNRELDISPCRWGRGVFCTALYPRQAFGSVLLCLTRWSVGCFLLW